MILIFLSKFVACLYIRWSLFCVCQKYFNVFFNSYFTFSCSLLGFLFFVPNVNGNSSCPDLLTACCLQIGSVWSCVFALYPDIVWNFLFVCNINLGSPGMESYYLHIITFFSFQFCVYIFPFEYLLGPIPPEEYERIMIMVSIIVLFSTLMRLLLVILQ